MAVQIAMFHLLPYVLTDGNVTLKAGYTTMNGSLDAPPIIIRSSSRVYIGVGVLCGVAVFWHIWRIGILGRTPSAEGVLALCVAALWLLFSLMQLLRPDKLILEPKGLTWAGQWTSRSWRWSEISNFRAGPLGALECDVTDDGRKLAWLRHLNKRIAGRTGAIGFGWTGGSDKVAALLSAARERWLVE
jgi:hypothetical protein